jgi:hypothetical protein
VLPCSEFVQVSKSFCTLLPTEVDADDVLFELSFIGFFGAEVAEVVDWDDASGALDVTVPKSSALEVQHLDGPKSTLSCHQEHLVIAVTPDYDRVQQAIPLDTVSKVSQGLLIEVAALTVRADDYGG